MVASPEIAKQNGKKSRGPVSERGKAIASQNATKHGMLAQQPPLLATENLETFQGIMQGLIDEYQPASPTEHLLVQQVAMGWLRLHRLWGVEAANANVEILKAQTRVKYPAYAKPSGLSSLLDYEPKAWAVAMKEERQVLKELVDNLTYNVSRCPDKPTQYGKWIREVDKSLYGARSGSIRARNDSYDHLNQGFWLTWDKLHDLIYDSDDSDGGYRKPLTESNVMKGGIEEVIKTAQKEVETIDQQLAEFEEHNRVVAQAEAASKGIQNPELFSRYERHINHAMREALDRLATIGEQRNNKGSIGSFGEAVVEGP